MRRILGIIVSLISIVNCQLSTVSAAERTPEQALQLAADFLASQPGLSRKTSKTSTTSSPSKTSITSTPDYSSFYAVNADDCFVLVGADDRMPAILGYSDSGTFDADNLPPAFQYFLSCYEDELSILQQRSALTSNSTAFQPLTAQRSISAALDPLLPTKWSQSAPYNDMAPAYNDAGSKCVTGCVATAMAQIMNYHKHPVKGSGSHSYLWICVEPVGKMATLSANFGATTYDWANMLNTYKSSYTEAQASAVATLMYHCGVSIDMTYGTSSGAYTEKVPVALNTYFGYDANYQRIQKVMYPMDSLNQIIRAELDTKRPILMSGSNDEGGHAFVCDGYNASGFFHINWGWGGSSDGYYLLSALNPGTQGIGGTTKGYNKGTSFFIGLQPAKTGTPKAIPQMGSDSLHVSITKASRSASFTASIYRLENFGLTDFSGSYGIALYDEDETKIVKVLKQEDNYKLSAGKYRTTVANLSSLTIPSTVSNGTYHLCAVYKDANYGWMRLMCTKDDYYKTVYLTSSNIEFKDNHEPPVLKLTKKISFPDPTAVNKNGEPLSFTVTNTGGTFRGEISARIYKGNFSKGQYELMDEVVIRRGKSLTSALQTAFDSNLELNKDYTMRVCYRASSSDPWTDLEPASYNGLTFKLYDPDYHLALTDTIRFDNNNAVVRQNANLHYSIKNTGAPFAGQIQLFFYKGNFAKGQGELRDITIGTNETVEGVFSGPLSQPVGTYTVILRYREDGGEWQEFIDLNYNNIGAITATLIDDTPSSVSESGLTSDSEVVSRLIMRLPAYDLYVITETKDNITTHRKVLIPR